MSRTRLTVYFVLVLGLLVSLCVLTLCQSKNRDAELDMNWRSWRLGLIALALRHHHELQGKLPPAVVLGKGGKPLYSWWVLVLPYLEQSALYKKFKLEEPWDSPHNRALVEDMPWVYSTHPNDPAGTTRYQVVVGTGTAFERPGLSLTDFPDGLRETILVVEGGEPVPWSKPVDLAYNPEQPLPKLGAGNTRPDYFGCLEIGRRHGFYTAFADGSCRFIDNSTDKQTIRSLITRNGSEKVDLATLK